MDDAAFLIAGPAQVEVDGMCLDAEIISFKATFEIPKVEVPRAGMMPVSYEQTFTLSEPRAGFWTRIWCALWWGHRPVRQTVYDMFFDSLTCRCGKVSDSRAHVEHVLR